MILTKTTEIVFQYEFKNTHEVVRITHCQLPKWLCKRNHLTDTEIGNTFTRTHTASQRIHERIELNRIGCATWSHRANVHVSRFGTLEIPLCGVCVCIWMLGYVYACESVCICQPYCDRALLMHKIPQSDKLYATTAATRKKNNTIEVKRISDELLCVFFLQYYIYTVQTFILFYIVFSSGWFLMDFCNWNVMWNRENTVLVAFSNAIIKSRHFSLQLIHWAEKRRSFNETKQSEHTTVKPISTRRIERRVQNWVDGVV